MRQQVPEGHIRRTGRNGDAKVLHVVVHGVVEAQEPVITELHHADRSERLGDRRNAEQRARVDRAALPAIGETQARDNRRLAVGNERDRHAAQARAAGRVERERTKLRRRQAVHRTATLLVTARSRHWWLCGR